MGPPPGIGNVFYTRISSPIPSDVKLTPIFSGADYTERVATFTVEVRGLPDGAATSGFGLTITGVTGLTFSGHTAGNAETPLETGIPTFTVTATYDGIAAVAPTLQTIIIDLTGSLPGIRLQAAQRQQASPSLTVRTQPVPSR